MAPGTVQRARRSGDRRTIWPPRPSEIEGAARETGRLGRHRVADADAKSTARQPDGPAVALARQPCTSQPLGRVSRQPWCGRYVAKHNATGGKLGSVRVRSRGTSSSTPGYRRRRRRCAILLCCRRTVLLGQNGDQVGSSSTEARTDQPMIISSQVCSPQPTDFAGSGLARLSSELSKWAMQCAPHPRARTSARSERRVLPVEIVAGNVQQRLHPAIGILQLLPGCFPAQMHVRHERDDQAVGAESPPGIHLIVVARAAPRNRCQSPGRCEPRGSRWPDRRTPSPRNSNPSAPRPIGRVVHLEQQLRTGTNPFGHSRWAACRRVARRSAHQQIAPAHALSHLRGGISRRQDKHDDGWTTAVLPGRVPPRGPTRLP